MKHDPNASLWTIVDTADYLIALVRTRTRVDYDRDKELRLIVERQLITIGEALNRLNREEPTLAARVPDLHKAIATRNNLVHGYDRVENDDVWTILTRDLPKLREVVQQLLNQ